MLVIWNDDTNVITRAKINMNRNNDASWPMPHHTKGALLVGAGVMQWTMMDDGKKEEDSKGKFFYRELCQTNRVVKGQ